MITYDAIVDILANFVEQNARFIMGGIVNIVLICIIFKIINFFNRKIANQIGKRALDDKKEKENPLLMLTPVLLRLLKVIVVVVLIATWLQSCGYNVTSLLAGLGITGLAIGFAAKETLGNFLGSFSIIADKVYRIGDYIRFDDKAGYVESLNLRSTSLRTVEGFLINVPNNILSNTCVTNVSLTSMYKIDIKVKIEVSSSVETVKKAVQIMQEIANNDNMVKEGAFAFVETIEDTALTLRLLGYTKFTQWREYTQQRSDMILTILERFQQNGIELDVPDSRLSIVDRAEQILG